MDRASIKKNPPRYLSLADALTKRLDPTRLDGGHLFSNPSFRFTERVHVPENSKISKRALEKDDVFSIRIDRSDDRGRGQRSVALTQGSLDECSTIDIWLPNSMLNK